MRPNVVYIVVDSIVGVQFYPSLYNSFLTQTPGLREFVTLVQFQSVFLSLVC